MKHFLGLFFVLFFLVSSQLTLAATCSPACVSPAVCDMAAGVCFIPPVTGSTTPTTGCSGDPNMVCTGLGDIPTEPVELVKWILGKAILLGGGIAFLLSVWGGATIVLSSGNPEKINEGKEIIGSAVAGLAFIILSVFLLRLLGFDILKLPDFSL